MDYNQLKKTSEVIMTGFVTAMELHLEQMTDAEFETIPVLELTKDQVKFISDTGWVLGLASRPGVLIYAVWPAFFKVRQSG